MKNKVGEKDINYHVAGEGKGNKERGERNVRSLVDYIKKALNFGR